MRGFTTLFTLALAAVASATPIEIAERDIQQRDLIAGLFNTFGTKLVTGISVIITVRSAVAE
jgi:hypothetical protein